MQLRVVREAGLPDEAAALMRAAQSLYEPNVTCNAHYVKFNRSTAGDRLCVGELAPDCRVALSSGQAATLHSFMSPARPLVLVAGSMT